jgi:5-methylcytosine-specific restriction protein B
MLEKDTWDEFLEEWPVERVKRMTLPEYTSAGDKTSFSYWLEFGLTKYGGIGGGAAFKFGIFSRGNSEQKESNNRCSYDDNYGWYTREGSTPDEAFKNIKSRILAVIEHVQKGELEKIDTVELGPSIKWKIAFHYQDRQNPLICAVFSHTALAGLCGVKPNARKISSYHRQLLQRKTPDESIEEFSRRLWADWLKIKEGEAAEEYRDDLPLNTFFLRAAGNRKNIFKHKQGSGDYLQNRQVCCAGDCPGFE